MTIIRVALASGVGQTLIVLATVETRITLATVRQTRIVLAAVETQIALAAVGQTQIALAAVGQTRIAFAAVGQTRIALASGSPQSNQSVLGIATLVLPSSLRLLRWFVCCGGMAHYAAGDQCGGSG